MTQHHTLRNLMSYQNLHRNTGLIPIHHSLKNQLGLAEKPKVTLHARVQSGVCVKKGQEVRIDAYISGCPYPKISWLRNDENVTNEPTKKTAPIIKKKSRAKVFFSP